MAETTKSIPLPLFETTSNLHVNTVVKETDATINPKAPATKLLNTFEVDNDTILKETNGVKRGVPMLSELGTDELKSTYSFIGTVPQMSVFSDPVAPIRFPQAEDVIKSLNFTAQAADETTKNRLTEYYGLITKLMTGEITADQYYAKMPSLIEAIKDYTLNEADWETLRDSILGVQRYLISFIWGDMQRISRSMDAGFEKYQKELNDWILKANEYYGSDTFIPSGAIKLGHFGRGSTGLAGDEFQVQQNVRYLIDGMCVQMSKTKPGFVSGNGEGTGGIDHYPTKKSLVWIEELDI